jgi:beta-glucosidase
MVHRILRSMFAAGVIDDPPQRRPIDAGAGAVTAQAVEERAAVLLRNEDGVLPLDPARVQKIAVIGSPANEQTPQGQGSAAVTTVARSDRPLGELRAAAPHATIAYDDGSDPAASAAAAKAADVAIVFARDSTSEGVDKTDLSLPTATWRCYLPGCYDSGTGQPDQDDLIAAVAKAQPRTVVVLMTGGPVTMPWIGDVAAVLEAWYPGEYGGHAIARLLTGAANPAGRLPITFPAADADLPTAGSPAAWPGDRLHIAYREKLEMGYRWYDARAITPLFPFGYGLTYGARFRYSGLRLGARDVRFAVTNTGTRAAQETPQVYVGFPASAGEPSKRLVGWGKRRIAPGATVHFDVPLDDRSLAYWSPAGWRVDPGAYRVYVGASERDIRLTGVLEPTGSAPSSPATRGRAARSSGARPRGRRLRSTPTPRRRR